jgi:Exopolysaccharide biosynthesis protein
MSKKIEKMKSNMEKFREWEWARYKKRKCSRIKDYNFTIIASNCGGTFIYYDMGLPYLTPTVNLSMGMNDFVKFAENLKDYLEQEFVEIKEESRYPIGLLGDIKINFVHYDTFEEGVRKWEERKNRINWDNLFIMGTDKDGCTYETIQRFEKLPYKNKVIFTHINYPEFPSAFYIKGFEDRSELGVITFFKKQFLKRRYLDDFDYVKFLNR